MPVAGLATDPRLVRHDRARQHPCEWLPPHRFTDAVEHEPRRLRGQAVLALDLAGGDAVLAGAHLKDHEQPRADRDLGAVEDGPGQYRELLATVAALPYTARTHRTGTGPPSRTVGGLQEH